MADKSTKPTNEAVLPPSPFVHLHTHSHYSLLQALPKIDDMVKKAKKFGMDTIALTDNGNLYGAVEFFKECDKHGLKPIIGVDFFAAIRTRKDKEPRIDNRSRKLILLAKDLVGYQNLVQLVTKSNFEGFYYRPRIDKELIELHKEGLIAILPSFGGEAVNGIRSGNKEDAKQWIEYYKSVFNAGMTDEQSADPAQSNLFIEITKHADIENHDGAMGRLVELAKETSIPLVAAQNVFYIAKDDKKARTTLLSVQKSFGTGPVEDDDGDFSFLDIKEIQDLFSDLPEAISNTRIIADRCNVKVELGNWVFPAIDINVPKNPDGSFISKHPYDDELRRIVYEGFEKRNVPQNELMLTRIEYELEVIRNKGYAPYFLVVADLLKFARENKILSNIRGSVSGSLTTFLAGITNINPIEYAIPFERFLNPDRPSAPDIDMDFADNRRDEMVEYARRKYGRDKVAQIGTFGTMAARGSVRDVTRALGFHVSIGDRLAKMIPMGKQGFPMTIELALEQVPELKEIYENEADTKTIIDMAKKIEGSARHISVHAAGVVISPTAITDFTPLQYDTKGENKIITQYDMYSIEDAGLLKFDFLGLKNLSIIADTLEIVEQRHGVQIELDKIPLDDEKSFLMLQRGETEDLFQLNGDGMTRFLKELKPTSIHDINAMVALYRPGPLQFIPDYIERKHDASKIPYIDPAIYAILESTYGVLVYQDDLLMMAHKLAGYTWGEVDKFRKAVGKKIPEEMALQKQKFIKGCKEHSGWEEARGEEVWKWIEPFASYGFNKAHSVSYGWVAYITAYLKANYTAEYMSAVLTHESNDIEKIAVSVHECKRMKIEVLPPDINESFGNFTVVDVMDPPKTEEVKDPITGAISTETFPEKKRTTIRFGMHSIKNFGEGIAAAIIEERKKAGKFKDLEDFLVRVRDRSLNKKSLESLIKAGALDSFGDRGVMMYNIEALLHFNKEQQKNVAGQVSLFAGLMDTDGSNVDGLRLVQEGKVEKQVILQWEKELLGLFVSGHPLDKYRHILDKEERREKTIDRIRKSIIEESEKYGEAYAASLPPTPSKDGKWARKEGYSRTLKQIAGIIEEVKEIPTKKDPTQKLLFLKLADFTGVIEMVVFPKIYEQFKNALVVDNCVTMDVKTSFRNETPSLILDDVKILR